MNKHILKHTGIVNHFHLCLSCLALYRYAVRNERCKRCNKPTMRNIACQRQQTPVGFQHSLDVLYCKCCTDSSLSTAPKLYQPTSSSILLKTIRAAETINRSLDHQSHHVHQHRHGGLETPRLMTARFFRDLTHRPAPKHQRPPCSRSDPHRHRSNPQQDKLCPLHDEKPLESETSFVARELSSTTSCQRGRTPSGATRSWRGGTCRSCRWRRGQRSPGQG